MARERGAEVPGAEPEAPIDVGKAVEFTMVEREDPDPSRGRIPAEAPVARAVVDRRVGEEAVVPAPRGP